MYVRTCIGGRSGLRRRQSFRFPYRECLSEKSGNVLVVVSPIDGNPRCVAERDLRLGEPLAFHEREWPPAGARHPRRGSDSFPATTRALGTVAIHLFERQPKRPSADFDQYNPSERVGGGAVADVSSRTASFVATELGNQNLKLFVGGGCRPGQPVTAAALENSWVLAPLDQLATLQIPRSAPAGGSPIAAGMVSTPSHIVDAGGGAICPARLTNGTTRWSVRPVTYRAVYRDGPKKGTHITLWTLIAERTGSTENHLDRADAFERAYFTRELGWTRWEGWKSANAPFRNSRKWASNNAEGQNERVLRGHDRVMKRGNCGLPESSASGSQFAIPAAPSNSRGVPRPDMTIVGCIEVTNIVPPRNKGGDPVPVGPGSWWYSIASANPVAAPLFGR